MQRPMPPNFRAQNMAHQQHIAYQQRMQAQAQYQQHQIAARAAMANHRVMRPDQIAMAALQKSQMAGMRRAAEAAKFSGPQRWAAESQIQQQQQLFRKRQLEIQKYRQAQAAQQIANAKNFVQRVSAPAVAAQQAIQQAHEKAQAAREQSIQGVQRAAQTAATGALNNASALSTCITEFQIKLDRSKNEAGVFKNRFRLYWKIRDREFGVIMKQQERFKYCIVHNGREKEKLNLPMATAIRKKYNVEREEFSVSLSGAQVGNNDVTSTFEIQLFDEHQNISVATRQATCFMNS